jgi:hypothetical protein
MGKKESSYISFEIEWLEAKVKELRDLVDAHSPFSDIPDRTEVEPNAKGVPVIKVIAKKEETVKMVKDIIKDLPAMFEALDKLREKEAAKVELRGGNTMNGMMSSNTDE